MNSSFRVEEVLSATTIAKRVAELGREIDARAHTVGAPLTLVGVLRGSFIFLADLSRAVSTPHTVDFLQASSYGAGTESSGVVQLLTDLGAPVEGRHVVLVEDIVDTGLTLSYLVRNLKTRNPAALTVVTLLDKPSRRKAEVEVDFVGFSVEDRFLVGYGLDWDQRFRHLPFVGAVVSGE